MLQGCYRANHSSLKVKCTNRVPTVGDNKRCHLSEQVRDHRLDFFADHFAIEQWIFYSIE